MNMPKLNIFDRKGKKVGTYDVEPTDLAPRINKQLLHDAVVMYQANLRQGIAPDEVARHGRRLDQEDVSPKGHGQRPGRLEAQRYSSWRRAHSPHPQSRLFGYRLPRKALQLATRMALAAKVRDDEVMVIDDLAFAAPKTKDMAAILKDLEVRRRHAAGGHAEHDANVYRSARNIAGVSRVAGWRS